jgi:tight adherence protein C
VLIPTLIFVVTSSLCFGILWLFMRSGRNQEGDVPAGRPGRVLMFGPFTPALAAMLPLRASTREQYAKFLRQAGHYQSQAMANFLSLRNVLVVGTGLLVAAVIVALTEPGDAAMYQIAIGGLIVVILMFALPRLVLETMAKNRTNRIEESLPDAMDMVTMCTSAGLPLQHAIGRVSEEMQPSHPDLAYELRLVGRQAEAASLNAAIQQFAKRLDIPEVHSVAAMVWQAEHQGASVAGAFHAFADQVRLSRRQRAEEAGNKASFKMLFPLVFCLVPAVYLMLLGPAAMDMREFFRRERQPGGALSREHVPALLATPATGPIPAVPGARGAAPSAPAARPGAPANP